MAIGTGLVMTALMNRPPPTRPQQPADGSRAETCGDETVVERRRYAVSAWKPSQLVSLAPATPWTRSANSLGLVA